MADMTDITPYMIGLPGFKLQLSTPFILNLVNLQVIVKCTTADTGYLYRQQTFSLSIPTGFTGAHKDIFMKCSLSILLFASKTEMYFECHSYAELTRDSTLFRPHV